MKRDLPVRQWLTAGAVIFAGLLLAALILPAIQQSRETARRTQTRNSLKQWMLAVENYEATFNLLPLGGSVDSDDVGHHGWPTRLIPYLAATLKAAPTCCTGVISSVRRSK